MGTNAASDLPVEMTKDWRATSTYRRKATTAPSLRRGGATYKKAERRER